MTVWTRGYSASAVRQCEHKCGLDGNFCLDTLKLGTNLYRRSRRRLIDLSGLSELAVAAEPGFARPFEEIHQSDA